MDLDDPETWGEGIEALVVVKNSQTETGGYIYLADTPQSWAGDVSPVRFYVFEYAVAALGVAISETAQAEILAADGNIGDGLVTVVIQVPEIIEIADADARAIVELLPLATINFSVEFDTRLRDFQVGKRVPFTYMDVSGYLQVQSVSNDFRPGTLQLGNPFVSVSAATLRPVNASIALARALVLASGRQPLKRQIRIGEPF